MQLELLLLAAGQSRRFNGIKQLAQIDGQPMIVHCLNQYRDNKKWLKGIHQGYVVLGANAELIGEVLPSNIDRISSKNWHLGMGHSIANSMAALADNTTHVMIALADQVAILQPMILKLLDAAKQNPNAIIAAKYASTLGVPCIFPKHYFTDLASLTGDKGAKKILRCHSSNVITVNLPQAGLDIDRQADITKIGH